MSLTKDRQGYLGDLKDLSVPQLQDLLDRQEKILSKKKFLNSLPDKGEKTRAFAEKLKKLISERSGKSSANNLGFSKEITSKIHNDDCSLQTETNSDIAMKDKDDATFEALLTRDETNAMYSNESKESENNIIDPEMEFTSQTELTLQMMQGLSVSTEKPQESSHPDNSYERVIRKAEADPSTLHYKFLPHKSKKENSSVLSANTNTKPHSSKSHEESAVHPPVYNHESTKLISIEESVQLIQEQKTRAEMLASERAAQRLANQLTTKMDPYQPPDVDMRYRQRKEEVDDDDQDSDDFPSDNDDDKL